jgi:2-C-methyl-D-erythritol 4-phosphate cytidylyltransferase/2-C-methyl-D-erythritol 2,4-cyclodiphosphate synthase
MSEKCKIVALIVAGGCSTRMNMSKPKQYLKLSDKTIFEETIDNFIKDKFITKIVCVISKDYEDEFKKINHHNLEYCFGGDTRQKSVRSGLEYIKDYDPEYVLIHDAARPFIPENVIDRVVDELQNGEYAVLPALKIKDTLKKVTGDNYESATEDREKLVSAQTPQGFKYIFIKELHEKYKDKEFTDDCSLVEILGMKAKIVEGDENNFKITTKEDYERAIMISQKREIVGKEKNQNNRHYRSGNGFDVHEFEEGDEVIICGVKIPYHKKLKGHSDADVGYHAITDALLGANGLGDIGEHFSDQDSDWKDCDSSVFLKFAGDKILDKSGEIINIDLTLICEEPKMKKHKDKMKNNIATCLGIKEDQINIKATTTEKMGFLGRKEGIAALATTSILV